MKKILLINPYIYDFAAYDFWVKPLGLLYLSSALKANGYSVTLIDCLDRSGYITDNFYRTKNNHSGKYKKIKVDIPEPLKFMERNFFRYGIPLDEFADRLKDTPKPDAICITCVMTYWYYGAAQTIKFIKNIFPDIPVILGGIYATLFENHAKLNSGADFIITGPAESKLPELLAELLHTQTFSPKTNCIEKNLPDYSLYDRLFSAAVMTSRGCGYSCSYCASKFLFNNFIQFDIDVCANFIESLVIEREVNDIAFYDDALLKNSAIHFIPFLKKIISKNLKCRFHLPNAIHIKLITDEIAELMFNAKFDTVRLGFESNDFSWLEGNSPKFDKNDFENCIRILNKAGIKNYAAYLLTGLPDKNNFETDSAAAYLESLGVKTDYAYFSPLPHTGYWKKSVAAFPQIENEPLLTNCSVFPVLSGSFKNRRKKI